MEDLRRGFAGKSIFVTGHTGFKGSWLAWSLLELGAEVRGYALAPEPGGIFTVSGLAREMGMDEGDLRDGDNLLSALKRAQPEIVFHLAAQALVLPSFDDPLGTFHSNVTGTLHLLEAVRQVPSVQVVVIVTSDKCYRNDGTARRSGFNEEDPLGGADPYSASKAMAELVTDCYRRSFLGNIAVASARAGNVIGGGDIAAHRIIPDAFRALSSGVPLQLRYPQATRPWQHVLDVLTGYLMLAHKLAQAKGEAPAAYNFGPPASFTVSELVDSFYDHMGSGSWVADAPVDGRREAGTLALDSARAQEVLGWNNRLDFSAMTGLTAEWYNQALRSPDELRETTAGQVRAWFSDEVSK